MKKEDKIIREIYWAFKNKIFNGHSEIKIVDGKLIPHKSFKLKEECSCYVCKILMELEDDIAKILGRKKYEETHKVGK